MTLQIREHKNVTFLKDLPRCEPLVVDSSAIKIAKECLRKYFYRIVLGFNDRETPIYFIFGSAIHLCAELWFKNITLERVARDKLAMHAAIDYYTKRVTPLMIQPKSKWDFMTLERLILSCKVLIDYFVTELSQGQITVIATEQIINRMLPDGNTTGGRSDQITRWKERVVGRDLKTTSMKLDYYERSIEPNDQFTRYTYIQTGTTGEVVLGQFVLVVMNSKTEGPLIKQFLTTRSAWQLEQWEKEQVHFNKILELCRETDTWPMEETACYRCPFRKTCCSASEAGIVSTLQTQFVRKPWDFTSIGEPDE